MSGDRPQAEDVEVERLAEEWITLWQSEMAALAADPEGLARLAASLDHLPQEVLEDKDLTEIAPAVQAWLAAQPSQNSVRSASRAPRSTS